jgi:hypothetical protein
MTDFVWKNRPQSPDQPSPFLSLPCTLGCIQRPGAYVYRVQFSTRRDWTGASFEDRIGGGIPFLFALSPASCQLRWQAADLQANHWQHSPSGTTLPVVPVWWDPSHGVAQCDLTCFGDANGNKKRRKIYIYYYCRYAHTKITKIIQCPLTVLLWTPMMLNGTGIFSTLLLPVLRPVPRLNFRLCPNRGLSRTLISPPIAPQGAVGSFAKWITSRR